MSLPATRPFWPATALLLGLAVLGLAVLGLAAGCANPIPPGGGPRDQRPPHIAASRPEAEATNVTGQSVSIQFDEYVERASLREALTVTPAPTGRLDFDWDQQRVEITFPEPLRDSTTYLLTIDKAFEDVRGVALEQPITLAFSTGDQIDRGRLSGRVIGNARGKGREGFDVYAYAAAASDSQTTLPEAPLYRTQTGPDGAFQFSYLREDQHYYVVVLRDRNRNYRADPLEAFAAPPRPSLPARPGPAPTDDDDAAAAVPTASETPVPGTPPSGTPPSGTPPSDAPPSDTTRTTEAPWVTGAEDSVPPRLTRAIPLSRSRFALRFSEPIRLRSRDPERFALTDTSTGRPVAVRSVYRRPGQTQRLTLRTAPMQPSAGHRARLVESAAPTVTDTSGNAPERPAEAAFNAPDRADTLGLRFRGFTKEGPPLPMSGQGRALVLAPGQSPAVTFNQPLASDSAATRRLLSARDTTTGDALRFRLSTDDGTTYRLTFTPPPDSNQVIRLRVAGRRLRPPTDTTYTRLVRQLPRKAQGAVSGAVQLAPDTAGVTDTAGLGTGATPPVLVELYATENAAENASHAPLRTTRADSSGAFIFENLPEASYRFRAFLDRDADGQWDAGRLAPYRPAEPLTWSRQPVEARPRWETATEDTLRIENFRL